MYKYQLYSVLTPLALWQCSFDAKSLYRLYKILLQQSLKFILVYYRKTTAWRVGGITTYDIGGFAD